MPWSPDGLSIVGKIKCLPGQVYIITGLASHGMMQGPGAAMLLASLMCGNKQADIKLQEADPNRFIKPSTSIQKNQISHPRL